MSTLTETAQKISAEILDLATAIDAESTSQPKGAADIMAAEQRRNALRERMGKLRTDATAFDSALNKLQLPNLQLMVWAQSLLDLPNAAILEIDTTSVDLNTDVLRVLLLSMSGDVLFDRMLRHPIVNNNYEHTGIEYEMLDQAQPIDQAWPDVIAELRKHYLMSYGMEFDMTRLEAQNTRLGEAPYRLFAEDLQSNLTQYFRSGFYTKLEDVAANIFYVMPDKPERDALDRAKATLAILRAVADGFVKAAPSRGEDFAF